MNSASLCWGSESSMTNLPFQLSIKCDLPEQQKETLTCKALLREIAGRREVYDARWGDKDVIIKIFSHKILAKYHLKREWRGLNLLRSKGLSAPKPLFYGKTEDGRWAMVVEKIADSSTALELFKRLVEKGEKLKLLKLVCRELAEQHKNGVLQKDLHLGNFLLANGKVFALDCGQMHFFLSEILRKKSISQLALLALSFGDIDSDTGAAEELCEEYALARQWQFNGQDKALFQKRLILHRIRAAGNGQKKRLRTGKKCLRISTNKYLAVFDREFCQGAEPDDLIKQIDSLMDKGQILKKGNTCYVSRTNWAGKDIVVKRYNHKGLIHSLRHTIKRSRAHRCWLNGHRLLMLGIDTPKPLAFIEEYRGPLVWKSYFITEYVDGQNLSDFLRDIHTTEDKRSKAAQQIKEMLDKLRKYRIIHGDLKHSNILVADNGPVLTDLDAIKVYKWDWTYKIGSNKSILTI